MKNSASICCAHETELCVWQQSTNDSSQSGRPQKYTSRAPSHAWIARLHDPTHCSPVNRQPAEQSRPPRTSGVISASIQPQATPKCCALPHLLTNWRWTITALLLLKPFATTSRTYDFVIRTFSVIQSLALLATWCFLFSHLFRSLLVAKAKQKQCFLAALPYNLIVIGP